MEEAPKSREVVLEELRLLVKNFYKSEKIDDYEKMVEFGRGLRQKYSDVENYELFHLLIGSSPKTGDNAPTEFDLKGEDSIEKFIRNQ